MATSHYRLRIRFRYHITFKKFIPWLFMVYEVIEASVLKKTEMKEAEVAVKVTQIRY